MTDFTEFVRKLDHEKLEIVIFISKVLNNNFKEGNFLSAKSKITQMFV